MPMLDLKSGEQIYYELIKGAAELPCLVFLHEGLGCASMWKSFPAMLCEASGCPGLVYDRLGYGKSAPLQAKRQIRYLHDYALRELPQVLALTIPARDYVLIGHSDGGSIALIHAAQQPVRLRGIITEAAHVFVEAVTLEGIRGADAAFDAGKLGALGKYHGAKTEVIFKAWSETWLGSGFTFWNIESLLPSIACPALIVQGANDQYGTEAQVDAIVSRASNAHKAMLAQCAHAPHREAPQAVLALMAGFVRQLLSPPA
jgi:pimeloyl-ACP methyl ester carboxylesterase